MESERSYCLMITNQPHQSSNDQFKVALTQDDILIQLGSKLIQQRYHFTLCGLGYSFSHNLKWNYTCINNALITYLWENVKQLIRISKVCIQDIVLSYKKYFQCGSSKHAIKSISHVTIRNKYKVLIKRFYYLLYIILCWW